MRLPRAELYDVIVLKDELAIKTRPLEPVTKRELKGPIHRLLRACGMVPQDAEWNFWNSSTVRLRGLRVHFVAPLTVTSSIGLRSTGTCPAPHCQVPQLTNQSSNIDATFRRQVQTVEPQFYRMSL